MMVIGFIQLMHMKFILVCILWYQFSLFWALIFLVTCFQQLDEWKLINIQILLHAIEAVKLGTIRAAQ